MRTQNKIKILQGFTLIEAVVGIGIAAILLVGVIGVFNALNRVTKVNRQQTVITNLTANELETIRNLPYSTIGTVSGNPAGNLNDQANPKILSAEGINYNIYYEVTYVDDSADGTILLGTDPAPNDYKQVKMNVQNTVTGQVNTFVTTVSPKGLEGLSNAGALYIKVFNASGQPVAGASVSITNNLVNPNIILNRQTDASGNWIEVGLPISVNGYHIVVSKSGYSSDQTYPITAGNPNPVKPDATIINGQVTQVSFAIDLVSTLNISTLNQTCQPLSNVGVNVKGSKLIGTNPNVLKFDQNFSSIAGLIALQNMEWDNYLPALLTGQNLMIYGTSPIQNINLLPGTTQSFTLNLGPETSDSLLVIVKDAATQATLQDAAVHLRKGGSQPQDYYGTTGGSVWVQNDWTGGPGQANFTDVTKYFIDDGQIEVKPSGVELLKITGDYVSNGELQPSTFDTGTASSNYSTITWMPTSQNPATTLKFQIASNNDNTTWDYKGPDGTSGTFYTVPGTSISNAHDSNRYVRYRALLSTTDEKKTPVMTSVQINYVSGCFTPGQVIFPGLTAGNNYDLDVTLAGYQTQILPGLNVNGYQTIEVLMSP
ncbi:MAG: hypothetical protein A2751_03410 [Candidatus Doudnabacteria bacterium RIFCSPHIGHO2_01_FULL_46_14]|uniref:Carboxypeptidase regulatory-like domain-containing protein n=1 Tax=Candidatus Doudnabacteria bacterium RIFCSPHIGHO2_01_FULL_46_14 TaxID=1817824 RepID=A0A1F5NKZ4_9BACT|nr:MAG: hypothetical protein A2751_03410 [Candidatus Doudnabacteria bacterium RIFCSPHIGHO2_01_FULL_46_14]